MMTDLIKCNSKYKKAFHSYVLNEQLLHFAMQPRWRGTYCQNQIVKHLVLCLPETSEKPFDISGIYQMIIMKLYYFVVHISENMFPKFHNFIRFLSEIQWFKTDLHLFTARDILDSPSAWLGDIGLIWRYFCLLQYQIKKLLLRLSHVGTRQQFWLISLKSLKNKK